MEEGISIEELGQCPGCNALLSHGTQVVRASWGRLVLACGNCDYEIPIAIREDGQILIITRR